VEFKQNDRAVQNMLTVVTMCVKAVQERWQKFDDLFESVSDTVSRKFMGYMHRRGHQVCSLTDQCRSCALEGDMLLLLLSC
jgi:hypothetical protein